MPKQVYITVRVDFETDLTGDQIQEAVSEADYNFKMDGHTIDTEIVDVEY